MVECVSKEQAGSRRYDHRLPNGAQTWLYSYIGTNAAQERATGVAAPQCVQEGALYPVAYLVEQAPDSAIPGHYHRADQFQVFIGGSGRFGNKEIVVPGIHYAAAYTPYAAISAAGGTLAYLTLRNGWDPGARWMPQHREQLRAVRRTPRAAFVAATPLPGARFASASDDAWASANLIEPAVRMPWDGLGAWHLHLAEDEGVAGPRPASGRGQFWFVMSGRCRLADRVVDEGGLWFVAPDEPPVAPRACPGGVSLLVVQFARRVASVAAGEASIMA